MELLTKKGAAVNYFCYMLHELDICQFYTHKVKLNYKVTLLFHYCQFYCMVDLSHNNNKGTKNTGRT